MAEQGKTPTIRDVAKHAGTSYQTVSRVLNNSERVAEKTRQRVLKAIEELNYRPNVAAQALNRDRTEILAVAIPFHSEDLFSDPNLLQIIHGIDNVAGHHDYSLLLSTVRAADDPLSPYRRLLNRQLADGVIVTGETVNEEGIQKVMEKGYRVVIVGYNNVGAPTVHADDEGGAYDAAQYLLDNGHEELAIITGPAELHAVKARQRGVMQAWTKELDPTLIQEGDFTYLSGYQAMEALADDIGRFSAIFAHTDRMAMGAIRWLNEHGYSVPDDISIVGFDDNPRAEFHTPSLTTVRLPSFEMGQQAAQLMFDMIDAENPQTTQHILPTELMVRGSVRPL